MFSPDMMQAVIAVPCFNEALRLQPGSFERFARDHAELGFVLVDDGSTDGTAALLESLRERLPAQFEVVRLPRNQGKAEAVRQGLLRALPRARYVGYWDADLATPLEAIPRFCAVLDCEPRVEFVFGARVQLLGRRIERRIVRHYLGRVFATVVSTMLRLRIYDTQCGAKLFRASPALRALLAKPFRTGWTFDVEILARLLAMPAPGAPPLAERIHELPLDEWRDVRGSKVRARDSLVAVRDLVRIWRTYLAPARRRARRRGGGAEALQGVGEAPR